MMSELERQQRDAVVHEALSWEGTPFLHHQRVKGAGVDCLGFLYMPFLETGLIHDIEIPEYSSQWFAHRHDDRLVEAVNKLASEIFDEPLPGDVVVVKIARVYAHSAIVIKWPQIIHASPTRAMVSTDDIHTSITFSGRPKRYFSYWGKRGTGTNARSGD